MNNPTITTEELLALTKSADLLRQTAERAMKADAYERELHQARIDRNAWEDAANGRYHEVAKWKQMHQQQVEENAALVERIGAVVIENETLARNMPPEPPSAYATKLDVAVRALEELSRLGNGDRVGTSEGNRIAADALKAIAEQIPLNGPARVPKLIGQQWCRTNSTYSECAELVYAPEKVRIVLCNVHRDTTTGALTYRPLAMEDLPVVQ